MLQIINQSVNRCLLTHGEAEHQDRAYAPLHDLSCIFTLTFFKCPCALVHFPFLTDSLCPNHIGPSLSDDSSSLGDQDAHDVVPRRISSSQRGGLPCQLRWTCTATHAHSMTARKGRASIDEAAAAAFKVPVLMSVLNDLCTERIQPFTHCKRL